MARGGPVVALAVLTATACESKSGSRWAPQIRFTQIELATKPGLSGLAADDDGTLWTVSERGREAYRITLSHDLVSSIATYEITGIPDQTDLEAMENLGGGRFAFGTEGKLGGAAAIATAELRDHVIAITGLIELPAASLGLEVAPNFGAEGLCGHGDTMIVGIESTGVHDGKRWAPLARIERGRIVRVHRLVLTSETGTISGLDCTITPDGRVVGWAIERYFDVTKLLRFALPAVGAGDDYIEPTVSADLGPQLQGRLNLEGIAEMPDGRVVTVIDNQWKSITGPSLLLVFPANALP